MARSKTELVDEVQGILKKFRINVNGGDNMGSANGQLPQTSLTMDQAVIRLLAICAEILTDIRQGDTNP